MKADAAAAGHGKPHVVFTITSGWGIRNFVQSGVFSRLNAHADISVATTAALRPYFEDAAIRPRLRELLPVPERESFLRRRLRQARKAVFQGVHNVATARIKRTTSDNALVRCLQQVSWTVQRRLSSQWQLDLLDGFERRLPLSTDCTFPDDAVLLVNTSPFDPRDNQVQRAARLHGLETFGIIPSWDNPSSKGCILPDTDRVLVWSPVQKDELLSYYPGFRPDQLVISGVPQFDAYRHAAAAGERACFLESLGIPAGRRIILFSTSSPKLFAHEPVVLRQIADAVEDGRLGEDVHVLVRCHPVDDAERYAAQAQRECVTVFPSSLGSRAALADWRPPESELDVLAATLRHCAVCVNTASTMTLDAASSGRPVVNIAYDPEGPEPMRRSVRRFYAYTHYARVVASGYAAMADSAEALIDHLAAALEGEMKDRAEGAKFVADFCPTPKGGSVAFIGDLIADAAHASSGKISLIGRPAT